MQLAGRDRSTCCRPVREWHEAPSRVPGSVAGWKMTSAYTYTHVHEHATFAIFAILGDTLREILRATGNRDPRIAEACTLSTHRQFATRSSPFITP